MKVLRTLLFSLCGLAAISHRLAAGTWTDALVSSANAPALGTAIGPNGFAQIAWVSASSNTLNYVYQDGTGFHTVTFTAAQVGIASFQAGSSSGNLVSIAVDSNNIPHIALGVQKSTGVTGERGVWYATYNGSGSISSASNWTFGRVATYTSPNGWLNVYFVAVAIDPTVNRPTIAWFLADSNSPGGTGRSSTLYYETRASNGTWPSGSVAISDTGTSTAATPSGATIMLQITGNNQDNAFSSTPFGFAIDSNGKHAFATGYNPTNLGYDDELLFGTDASGSWVTTNLKSITNTSTNLTFNTAVAFDSSNRPRVLWADYRDGSINLQTYNGTTWSNSVVSTSLSGAGSAYFPAMSYALAGPFELVAFGDKSGSTYSVRTATRSGGSGSWTVQTAASSTDSSGLGYDVFGALLSGGTAVIGYDYGELVGASGSVRVLTGVLAAPNTAPTFVGATTTLAVNQNASATDIKSLLHVSDSDSSQTETWSQSSAPSHGTLSFSTATAASGSTDITPGGTITYTPTAGYFGSDSFTVQVSDATATATRTITVTVSDVTKPTVASVVRQSPGGQNLAANASSVTFRVTYSEALNATPVAARYAIENVSGGTVTGNIGTPSVVSTGVYDVVVTITGGSGEFRLKVVD